jgi:uncharacterized protein (DUF58 family)
MMIREFETETDRAVWLVVDATASMAYRGPRAPSPPRGAHRTRPSPPARVALATGDPMALQWLGGQGVRPLPPMAGREAFERVLGALESAEAAGDASADAAAAERAFAPVARKARRGAVVVLFSDLLDLPERALSAFAALGTGGRALVAVQVLDPTEIDLDFAGQVRLRALEGDAVVEADADAVRAEYQARLQRIAEAWSAELAGRGGRLVRASTADAPAAVLRRVVRAIAEARR